MARRREVDTTGTDHRDVIRWYRRELGRPAVVPWAGSRFPPVAVGPTWQIDGGRWVLPDRSLGWDVIGWCGTELQGRRRVPWRFTLEQARFLLWWYAVDDAGRWLYRDGVLQRLKGWGKDPIGATVCATELVGPARFDGFVRGRPAATDVPEAWVQTAATALDQTKNTMRLFPSLFTAEAKARYGLQIGKEMVHAMGDERLLQAVTSSPATLEGARATAVLMNETHHWKANNEGHEMAATIRRNAAKSEGGTARTLRITNAYNPSEESVAQQDREAWEASAAGTSLTTGILYDSLEAAPGAPLTAEDAPEVVAAIRGDSLWLDVQSIVAEVLDTRNPPSRTRRFWYNQVGAAEDAWTDPLVFDARARPAEVLADGTELALFFDGSKSDDATGIVGARLTDGHVFTLGLWQKPPGDRGREWLAPRAEVDARVDVIFARYRPLAFFGDPSHTRDDETDERFWDDTIDGWHRRYRDRLKLWAQPGKGGHAVMWDMASPARSAEFTEAAMRCAADIGTAQAPGTLTHDGDPRLRNHVHNARRYPNRYGVSLWKGHRESARKIDLAVCMVGARMVRRLLLNAPPKDERTGEVW